MNMTLNSVLTKRATATVSNRSLGGCRIAIFSPNTDFTTNPTLVSLACSLQEEGASLDLFAPTSEAYSSPGNGIRLHSFPWMLGSRPTPVARTWHFLRAQTQLRYFRSCQYDLVIGVDPVGLITARRFAEYCQLPLVYLSFELFFRDEIRNDWWLRIKEMEVEASRAAQLIVTQDKWRKQLLEKENQLDPDLFALLPVSPKGPPQLQRSNELRRRFGIAHDSVLVLHAGSFASWTYADELCDSLEDWPPGFDLVVHTRNKRFMSSDYAARLSSYHYVHISTSSVPIDCLDQLYASADIGLSLYKSSRSVDANVAVDSLYSGRNIETIGLSSGKTSYYAKHGIPIVSVGQRCFDQLLCQYQFGVNLRSCVEIPDALPQIWSNYRSYSSESRRFFDEQLDFNLHWPHIISRLVRLL